MSNITILDCTLRDGGYVNNWLFGERIIKTIAEKLDSSSVEIIEGGFLSQTKATTTEQSIFGTIKQAEQYFLSDNKKFALMINCGEYDHNDIPEYSGGCVSTIRIAFHKHQRDKAQKLCVGLKAKGYRVFFQPMVTMGYTDLEMLSLIEWANDNRPDAFYIVDSFGTMRKNDVMRIFYLIDNNLNPKIKVGFHSHNNLQLSFSNAQELISLNSNRDIIIDTSVFGMGRGAGNLCTELLTQYINENIENKYDLIPILEIMDECIMPIYAQHPWGYSAPYYIAAINNCHPNYATYLMERESLCVRDINAIIKSIPNEKRHLYDKELVSRLYTEYQQNTIDDTAAVAEITKLCRGRNILILAPGKSLVTMHDKITDYIEKNDPVVFAVNHIPEQYRFDRVFISNLKRFSGIDDAIERIESRIICTSNISASDNVCAVNYSSYLNEDDNISDNSGLMIINILRKAGINAVALAGYDGFRYSAANNYYDEKMINNVQYEKQEQLNRSIITYFTKLRKTMDITFITPTIYDGGNINE